MRPIQSLLCPINLERPSSEALRYAFFLADAFYASLEVTCTLAPPPDLPASAGAYRKSSGGAAPALHERIARRRLDELLRGVTTAVPGRAAAHIVEGEPVSGVLRCALRFQSDLIVLGSHFEARPDWVFGASLGEKIAHAAPCPALSVHEGGRQQPIRLRHILVPVDARSQALALEWTTVFARCFDATVELLYIPSAHVHSQGSNHVGTVDRDGAKLDELREKLRMSGVRVDDTSDEDGTTFDRILKRTESGGCDLVVMVAEPRSQKMSPTERSLTASVRRHASIPVLSVCPPGSHLTIVPRECESEIHSIGPDVSDWNERASPA